MGTNWLGIATRPSVAMTAVSPSNSGTPAATSAPKARIRMISVIGSERNSAFLKSSENDFESALLALAPPNWPTKTFGLAAFAFTTDSMTGSMRLLVWSSLPRTLNSTSTERPSFESWPSLPLA